MVTELRFHRPYGMAKKQKVKKSIVLVVEKADNFRYQHQLPCNLPGDTAAVALSPPSGIWTSGFTQRQV